MALGGDRFGLGINWLQRLAEDDHDQGRGPLVSKPDLPPMFRPGSGLHPPMTNDAVDAKIPEDPPPKA